MWILSWKGATGFSASSTAEEVTRGIEAYGLTAIITGPTSGIGLETARILALRGVHVVMAVRNTTAGHKIKQEIINEIPKAKIDVMELNVASLKSVNKFVTEFKASGLPLNILINNAGMMAPPFTLSEDNIELQLATNHIGHFHMTNGLLETMKNTAEKSGVQGRIVIVSSVLQKTTYKEGIRFDKINDEKSYNALLAYGQSKLANALHAKELARRLKEEGVNITVNSLHPGVIATNLARHTAVMRGTCLTLGTIFDFWVRRTTFPEECGTGLFLLTEGVSFSNGNNGVTKDFFDMCIQGASTTCYLAIHPGAKGISGEYWADNNISSPSGFVNDPEFVKKFWDFSVELVDRSLASSSL
ncbi:putative very-long-chain 3-oxoacyl-CoA reductase [Helianthus annuus]|nr:putative very-long-chain 3-oxoacyl-CoA reductase [Helianthus annuus]